MLQNELKRMQSKITNLEKQRNSIVGDKTESQLQDGEVPDLFANERNQSMGHNTTLTSGISIIGKDL